MVIGLLLLFLGPTLTALLFSKFMEHREKDKEENNGILGLIIVIAILIIIGQISN